LLQDRLRGTLDELLGLLQAEGGPGAHLLDDVDLLVTRGIEDDGELVLLGCGLATTGATGSRGCGNGDRSGSGDAEGLLELLHELGELDEGHLLESVKELCGAELRHDGRFLPFGGRSATCGTAGVSGGVRRPEDQ